jgi:hypothetical protein
LLISNAAILSSSSGSICSERWPWSYEAVDTKLALATRPAAIVQLCGYSEQLVRLQGTPPKQMCVVLGDGVSRPYLFAAYAAYYRTLVQTFRRHPAEHLATYPLPVAACERCVWDELCTTRRDDDDHLSLVARIRADQVKKLAVSGIMTLAALAQADDDARPARLAQSIFATLRLQARLQAEQRAGERRGEPDSLRYELLAPRVGEGFALLPQLEELLHDIERYNEDDCRSTLALRCWLDRLSKEAERRFSMTIFWQAPVLEVPEKDDAASEAEDANASEDESLARRLLDGIETPATETAVNNMTGAKRTRWLRRSSRRRVVRTSATPTAFRRRSASSTARAGFTIRTCGNVPVNSSRSRAIRALIPGGPLSTLVLQKALRRLATAMLDGSLPEHSVARELLARHPPRRFGVAEDVPIQPSEPTGMAIADAVALLNASYLFVQGPPGSGKTTRGAAAIVELLARGLRVGVTARSHAAIDNLLDEIDREAAQRGTGFRGLRKKKGDAPWRFITVSEKLADFTDEQFTLLAGTAWLFARDELRDRLDVLVIDEAGQSALADVIAVSGSARNLLCRYVECATLVSP